MKRHYSLFILLGLFDIVMTKLTVIDRSNFFIEANLLAKWLIQCFGLSGLILLKVSSNIIVLSCMEYIKINKLNLAKTMMTIFNIALFILFVYSISIFFLFK